MMRACILLLAISLVHTFAFDANANAHLHLEELTHRSDMTWKAGYTERFAGKTFGYAASLCGTDLELERRDNAKLSRKQLTVPANLPDNFDARANWPQCPIIAHIRDQADCGSCWAFGSTEAFNDRKCIASNGTFTRELAAQDTTSCCDFWNCLSMGCGGGQPSAAWSWFVSHGVVTGGDYAAVGKGDSCWPYQLPMCAHHVNDPNIANCSSTEVSAPACSSTCSESGYPTAYAQDKIKATKSYSVSGEQQIMTEIMMNGPVTGAFTVYADLLLYKSGVYSHTTGDELGGHAIKIFGWGVENGQKYWWVANSWNNGWGDNGSFKILRGSNECGIEGQISAGDA